MIFVAILLLIAGFVALVKGADVFVDGAAALAGKFGIPQLVIGLTIVAMGTSLPEAAVSITAGTKGNAGITVGNIVGRWYLHRLTRLEKKTGIHFEGNPNIGKGLIIGHYGRIIINSKATFGDQIYITHGVTIGRNATGKKAGVPHIGNKVRIGANACIVGNIKIGDDVMIAPNTFVNVDVPDHSVVIGNPCIIHHKDNATNGYLGFL